ncbi:MAG TPA: tetratricopeptide repeat protein [Clostridiales bacterium]|nr:MAG: hypothetical protein BWY37_01548 [Firmicutes bacterium ADurb.Bin262]HOU09401.1 tetratricopeptide repeat protein [Clostridiales bacterium]HQH62087.1 tetratricopeptide repeat protein [Clostridiales bacterium]
MAFIDDKKDKDQSGKGLDPADEILKRLEEMKANTENTAGEDDFSPDGGEFPPEDSGSREDTVEEDEESGEPEEGEVLQAKAPLGVTAMLYAFAMFLLTGFSVLYLVFTVNITVPVYQARNFEAEKRYGDASDKYTQAGEKASSINDLLSNPGFFATGTRTYVSQQHALASASNPISVGESIAGTYKDDSGLKGPWLKELKTYLDEYNAFLKTRDAVQAIIGDYTSSPPEKIPFDDLANQIEALKSKNKYPAYLLDYFKCYVAALAERGADKELEMILEVKKQVPDKGWLYNGYIADIYKRLEKYDEAAKIYREAVKDNRNDTLSYVNLAETYLRKGDTAGAMKVWEELDRYNKTAPDNYRLKAEIYRRQKKFEAAAAVCEKGIKETGGSTELFRQQAIVLLLQGKTQESFEAVYNAYSTAYYSGDTSLELMNTIALCAGLTEKALPAEVGKLKTQSDAAKKAADALKPEADRLKLEADVAKKEMDELKKSADLLAKDQDKNDQAKKQYEAAKAAYDIAKKEYDAVKKQYDTAKKAYDTAKKKADSTKTAYDRASGVLEQAKSLYSEVQGALTQYGYKIEPVVLDCINGKAAVEDIFLSGSGDVL